VYGPELVPNPVTRTAYDEPGKAGMETRDCIPHASSFAAAHMNIDEFVGHRTPGIKGVDTTSSVSHVVPVHVSSVRVPPKGAFLGMLTISIFSPTEDA